ncbi:MAG: epimerase [Stenotrophomonas rhizophila]|jgi:nucleoside-diphosphate-sugar epimerase|nr:epimerase [Stenotrophomonas rhizophila]
MCSPVKILLTGSSGRVGRAIFGALAARHEVVGIDRSPFATTRHVADFTDIRMLAKVLQGVDAVIHAAALHAPHVGLFSDSEFQRINVEGTRTLAMLAREAGVRRLVFTSTTALYGYAIVPGRCTWVDEQTTPQPRTVYHRSKLAAEQWLEEAAGPDLDVRVIRMSRCFPEPPERMMLYRLHRGIDVRDVADAHVAALTNDGPAFQRYLVTGWTPFQREDCEALVTRPRDVLAQRCPQWLAEYDRRGWSLPVVDRIHDARAASVGLQWRSWRGPETILEQLAVGSIEVLPDTARIDDCTIE